MSTKKKAKSDVNPTKSNATPVVTMDKDEATVVNGPKVKKGKTKPAKELKHGPSEPAPKPAVVDQIKAVEVKVEPPKPAAKKSGITANMVATLAALKSGKTMTHTQIVGVTGREKGNRLRELTAAGLVSTSAQEGVRGYVYSITEKGKKALAEAQKS